MRVHVVALASSTDAAASGARALAAVRRAADAGADLVVLPEYVSAFDARGVGRELAEPLDTGFVPALRALARECGVAVVAGTTVPDGERAANVVVAVDAAGELAGAYRKVHLYDAFGHRESDRIVAGDADEPPVVMAVGDLTVGVMTCYDLRFPESARRLVDAGAQVIAVPAAWAAGDLKEDHWRTLLRARAIENTCFVLGAAHQGAGVVGRCMVVDPDGVVLAEAGLGEAGLDKAGLDKTGLDEGGLGVAAVADLSAQVVAAVRGRNPSLDNRRYAVVPASGVPMTGPAAGVVTGVPAMGVWDRWLVAALGVVGLLGVVLAAAAGPAVAVFDELFFGGSGPVPDGPAADYVAFVYRVLGAVLIGWTIGLMSQWRALRRRDRRAWWAIAASVGAWYVVDTTCSLAAGFPENALLNTVLAILIAVPLVGIRREGSRRR